MMDRLGTCIVILLCGLAQSNSSAAPSTSYRSSGQQIRLSQNGSQTKQQPSTSDSCNSQPPDLNFDHAMEMIRLVTEKATELKTPVVICIRDRHDNLVAHIRMKNALLGSIELACQKARSSALFPFPSSVLAEYSALQLSNGVISGVGGALPLISSDGVHVGSIGVSGAPTGEIDEEIAKAAADNIDNILKESCCLDKWTATGEVPTKLAEAPKTSLDITFNNKNVLPNEIIKTENMLEKPALNWATENGALYTIFFIDFGIERLEGLQWVHWLA